MKNRSNDDPHQERSRQLIREVATGNARALAELYDLYGMDVQELALWVVGPSEAEDVLHDAFLAAWEHAGSYDERRGSVVAWLLRIVRNGALDRLRRLASRRRVHESSAMAAPRRDSCPEHESEVRRLYVMLEQLPDEQRVVLELAFFAGLSYPEIGALEGVPVGTVKSRAARAMGALRAKTMEDSGERRSPFRADAPDAGRKRCIPA